MHTCVSTPPQDTRVYQHAPGYTHVSMLPGTHACVSMPLGHVCVSTPAYWDTHMCQHLNLARTYVCKHTHTHTAGTHVCTSMPPGTHVCQHAPLGTRVKTCPATRTHVCTSTPAQPGHVCVPAQPSWDTRVCQHTALPGHTCAPAHSPHTGTEVCTSTTLPAHTRVPAQATPGCIPTHTLPAGRPGCPPG